ncbi:hypothetical protein PanWU01x14_210020 [Parasponia andersonii]|uniref:Uncharacterized protein n=1 Tax=Parasponia andersonii TaxID=3476 RepID=A0A2P5BU10_PARAD|nr:hypothetical protein PanWU01x14_210020 [Parasponia andersonii]
MIHEQQPGHRIKPFSLQSEHLLNSPWSSSNTFRLPLQLGHGRNLTPPHPLQTNVPGSKVGNPFRSNPNSPFSWSCFTSSDPPMYFPLIKT